MNEESTATEGTEGSLACSMTSMSLLNSNADSVTKIYICATMWHETKEEMVQTLKSIIRYALADWRGGAPIKCTRPLGPYGPRDRGGNPPQHPWSGQ